MKILQIFLILCISQWVNALDLKEEYVYRQERDLGPATVLWINNKELLFKTNADDKYHIYCLDTKKTDQKKMAINLDKKFIDLRPVLVYPSMILMFDLHELLEYDKEKNKVSSSYFYRYDQDKLYNLAEETDCKKLSEDLKNNKQISKIFAYEDNFKKKSPIVFLSFNFPNVSKKIDIVSSEGAYIQNWVMLLGGEKSNYYYLDSVSVNRFHFNDMYTKDFTENSFHFKLRDNAIGRGQDYTPYSLLSATRMLGYFSDASYDFPINSDLKEWLFVSDFEGNIIREFDNIILDRHYNLGSDSGTFEQIAVSPNGFWLACGTYRKELQEHKERYHPYITVFNVVRDGKITDDSVRLRKGPGTNFDKIITLDKNLEVKVIDKSSETETIDGQTDFWYKIRLSVKTEGWVFGAFLWREDN